MRVSNLKVGDRTTESSIHIVWSPIDSSPGNGGVELIDYKVYWAKDDGNWDVLSDTTFSQAELETQGWTDQNLGLSQYKFMVQAYNRYGYGPNSTILYASVKDSLTGGPTFIASAIAAFNLLISLCS